MQDRGGIFEFSIVKIRKDNTKKIIRKSINVSKLSKMLNTLSQNCGFYFVDLYPYFRDYDDKESLYFQIDAHLSPAGHKYGSEILYNKLKEYGLM